jgi:hypothetical protein
MSDHYYKIQLYPLQDKVLQLIGQTHSDFYLTGGTLLGRYLLHHRYSDDLDLFMNSDLKFSEKVDLAIQPVLETFSTVEVSSRQETYARYFVMDGNLKLKVEFINDVKYRVGIPIQTESGLLLDTWENVLSNKVTALSRFAAKDFIDILFISFKFPFNWELIIDEARQKDASINEIEVSERLMNFDLSQLKDVIFPSDFATDKITKAYFEILARESLHGFDNSLAGKSLS